MNQISVFRVTTPIAGRLHNSQSVYEHFQKLGEWDREAMTVLYLNADNAVIHQELLSIGTLTSAVVYPREVMKIALLKSASAIILIHNHPSGNPDPSMADRQITLDVMRVGKVLEVKVHDHIIIGNKMYYSFADHGMMQEMELHALSTPLIGDRG